LQPVVVRGTVRQRLESILGAFDEVIDLPVNTANTRETRVDSVVLQIETSIVFVCVKHSTKTKNL